MTVAIKWYMQKYMLQPNLKLNQFETRLSGQPVEMLHAADLVLERVKTN